MMGLFDMGVKMIICPLFASLLAPFESIVSLFNFFFHDFLDKQWTIKTSLLFSFGKAFHNFLIETLSAVKPTPVVALPKTIAVITREQSSFLVLPAEIYIQQQMEFVPPEIRESCAR